MWSRACATSSMWVFRSVPGPDRWRRSPIPVKVTGCARCPAARRWSATSCQIHPPVYPPDTSTNVVICATSRPRRTRTVPRGGAVRAGGPVPAARPIVTGARAPLRGAARGIRQFRGEAVTPFCGYGVTLLCGYAATQLHGYGGHPAPRARAHAAPAHSPSGVSPSSSMALPRTIRSTVSSGRCPIWASPTSLERGQVESECG